MVFVRWSSGLLSVPMVLVSRPIRVLASRLQAMKLAFRWRVLSSPFSVANLVVTRVLRVVLPCRSSGWRFL